MKEREYEVLSFVENSYSEGYASGDEPFDFEKWMQTERANKSFDYDSQGAMTCNLLIYISPSGKDAAAECGMCYGQRFSGKTIPMYALYAKGEDFGLMRKMFDRWFDNYLDLIIYITDNFKTN